MRIALSAGHHPSSPGACHAGKCEHELAAVWCQLIATELINEVELFYVPTGSLRDKVAAINKAQCDIAIEIHFNACGDCGAFGSETLHCPGSTNGISLAMAIQSAMVGATHTKDRGIKEGWYKMKKKNGPDYFLSATNCTAVILEPEFIEQYHRVENDADTICKAIANAIKDHVR